MVLRQVGGQRLAVSGLLVSAVALGGAVASAQNAGVAKVSSMKDRSEVSITIYNQGFGLVREIRDVDLAKGRVALEFRDVASQIQPETVAIKPLGGGALNVLEQNYRYDLLSPQKLLEKYVGKRVRVYRWNEKLGKEDAFDAEVLAYNGGQSVLKINGEITYDFPGRIAFPEVPANLIAKPTLVWLLDGSAPKQKVEVTYLTRGFSWQADYVMVIDEKDTRADLQGWVTLNNNTGATYENAKLKLVAGDVQKISPGYGGEYYPAAKAAATASAPPPKPFNEEGFFEYHLYTLNQPTTVQQNEQKQITLLEAKDVGVNKKLMFYGASYWYRGSYGQVVTNQKVGVYLDIKNEEKNHLGMPLPKGIVRVYKADKSGAKQFIGEDRIDHTPRDEKIRVKMGEAFDVVADRKQITWKSLGTCVSESEWEASVRNHKDVAETVELWEPIGGDWEIVSSTHPAQKQDSSTFTFTVNVPKKGETKVHWRVRVRWC